MYTHVHLVEVHTHMHVEQSEGPQTWSPNIHNARKLRTCYVFVSVNSEPAPGNLRRPAHTHTIHTHGLGGARCPHARDDILTYVCMYTCITLLVLNLSYVLSAAFCVCVCVYTSMCTDLDVYFGTLHVHIHVWRKTVCTSTCVEACMHT